MEASVSTDGCNVTVDQKVTDFVKTVETSDSGDGVINVCLKQKREVIVKTEEITLCMSAADEQTFTSLLEENLSVEESTDVKTDKWEPHPSFGKEFTDQLMEEALQPVVERDKPFTYLQCPNSFKLSSDRKSHLQMHTGEKTFKCFECKTTFRGTQNPC